jgi:hypothetical protein
MHAIARPIAQPALQLFAIPFLKSPDQCIAVSSLWFPPLVTQAAE